MEVSLSKTVPKTVNDTLMKWDDILVAKTLLHREGRIQMVIEVWSDRTPAAVRDTLQEVLQELT